MDYIKRLELFEKETYRVILKNEKVLPVSKSGYSKLKDILNN
ncbi:MAG TPA: LytTR family transcriptional regulator DNA-binding domain-containing protein [Ignavibacteriaceae bacterium]|nr:LytTR family transcriptional regulator DNA-binding domain-containing protein [Ignavibacteriaceae bacterium]